MQRKRKSRKSKLPQSMREELSWSGNKLFRAKPDRRARKMKVSVYTLLNWNQEKPAKKKRDKAEMYIHHPSGRSHSQFAVGLKGTSLIVQRADCPCKSDEGFQIGAFMKAY